MTKRKTAISSADVLRPVKHWAVWVKKGETQMIGRNIWSSQVVIQNRGPGHVAIDTGAVAVDPLSPGGVLVAFIYEHLKVTSTSKKPAQVEFEIAPIMKPIVVK